MPTPAPFSHLVPFDDLDAMVGKTVSGYYENEWPDSSRVYLFFTDDTVLRFERSGEDVVVGEVTEHAMRDPCFVRDMAECSIPGAKAALVALEDESDEATPEPKED